MVLLQAYPSVIPVAISETDLYLVMTVLIFVALILNIRYVGMILSIILGGFTLFFGTNYWHRFGLGPTWAQVILIIILIILSIKNFILSIFKRESVLHHLTRNDRYLLTFLLDDLRLSYMRKYQAISFWFPILVFTYFIFIEKSLLEILLANPQRTGTALIIGLPLIGIVFSIVYLISITIKEDFIPEMIFPVVVPSVEVLDIFFDCVVFYLLLKTIASIIGWKGFLKYSSIQLISYSLPIVAIVIWRWETYEALSILLYYFISVTGSAILLFLLERSKIMNHIRSRVKSNLSKIKLYIDKMNLESSKLPEEIEEVSEEDKFLLRVSKRKNWVNWPKTPSKLNTFLIPILIFLPKKLASLGRYIKSKTLTFKFRPIKQKDEYDSFKSKFVDIYLVPLKYIVILILTLPIYAIVTRLFYQAVSISRVFALIQTHPEHLPAIILFVITIIGIIYLALLLLYIIFSQWLRKYRTVFIYGEDIKWNELTYHCIVEARDFNTKNRIKKAYQYLILALYYNFMGGLEFVEVGALYKIRKGARLYRRKKIKKALRYFDKVSKGMYNSESLKHFGHIYDLIGNYYRKQDNSSKAIYFYLKSQKFNAKVKNWNYVDILENKIKELNI